MPAAEQECVIQDMRDLCAAEGLPFEHCFLNILKRNGHDRMSEATR